MPYQRPFVTEIKKRINEPRNFIQIVIGPRQTGKTTAVTQALAQFEHPVHYVEATRNDSSEDWLRAQWYLARNFVSERSNRSNRAAPASTEPTASAQHTQHTQRTQHTPSALLVIDEVQYVRNWSAVVKTLWDEDTRAGLDVRVLLTGSSATLLQSGLSESLMGRFEIIESPHWFFAECRDAFGCSLDDFLYYGAYPGAMALIADERRWLSYVKSAIIEPSIAIDVPQLGDVRRPELMRKLFEVGALYSDEEISYRKLLGQLDDRGNTATIAHYLTLLARAGLMSGLEKYDAKLLREKASSPRLIVHNTALMTAMFKRKRTQLRTDPALHGRLVESAVGAYLINRSFAEGFSVQWWREGADEVDFVITQGEDVTAIEVKSGKVKSLRGMQRFILENPHARAIVVGATDVPLESFLLGEVPLFV